VTEISVLVVDDHAIFADALQARLSREADLNPVAVAYSVGEGRSQLARVKPAVAVLDLTLADGTGLELAGYIRDNSPSTRVVILSAAEPNHSVLEALRLGVRAWLPKTIDTAHLVQVVRGVHAGEAWFAPALLGRVLTDLLAPPPDPLAVLTSREREVLRRMVAGLNRADIANELRVSVNTVRSHTQNLMAKLDAHSVLEAVSIALRNGMTAAEE
jgi:DNA-binding NarL/FixJ family response regulator